MLIKGRSLYWLLEYHDVCKDFLKWSQKFFIGALGQILITLVQKLCTIFYCAQIVQGATSHRLSLWEQSKQGLQLRLNSWYIGSISYFYLPTYIEGSTNFIFGYFCMNLLGGTWRSSPPIERAQEDGCLLPCPSMREEQTAIRDCN